MKLRFINFILGLTLFLNYTIAQPAVSSIAYDASTGSLSFLGSNFLSIPDPDNDIDASKITVYGSGSTGYTLSLINNVDIIDAEHFNITLAGPQKTDFDNLLNRNGLTAWDGNSYRVDFAELWNSAGSSSISSPLNVNGILSPQITSAEFNFGNGRLTITGTNLKNIGSTNDDIDVTKLTIGNGTVSYTLTGATPSADATGTSVTLVVQGVDKSMLNYILNRDGTTAESGLAFVITAAAGWNGFGEPDTESNPLTVTSYLKPQVSSIAYDASSGVLTVTGSYLASITGGSNDIDASKFQITGYQDGTYTLSSSFNTDLINETSFKINLSGTDRTQVEILLNRDGTSAWGGTSYNLQLSDGWNCGIPGSADVANSITVSGVTNQPPKVSDVNLGGDLINGKNLSLTFVYSDLEGDVADTHTINWYTYTDNLGNGKTLITGVTGTSYTLSTSDIGLFINVEITPVAQTGTLTGALVSSPLRGPVLNAAPYATAVNISGSLYLNNTITGEFVYNDREYDVIGTCTYKWYRASSIDGPDEEITGENSLTYKIKSADLNKYLSFEVIPVAQTGTLTGTAVRTGRIAVQNEAPKAASVAFSGSMYKNQVLTGSYEYSDLEGDLQGTTSLKWYRSDAVDGPYTEIANATSLLYTLSEYDLNKYISFIVTPVAQSGTLTGTGVQSERKLVLNESPKASNISISANRYLDQEITASYDFTDLENDPQGISTFKWYRASSSSGPDEEIAGATGTIYKIKTEDLNKYLSFEVTPVASSGNLTGTPVRSQRVEVLNEAPKASNVDLSGNMYLSQELTGTYNYSDLEDDVQGTSSFKWYRADDINGPDIEIIGASNVKYTIAAADLNKFISFEVTPVASNGTAYGNPVKSSRRGVLNEAPKASALSISGNRYKNQEVTAEYTYSDLESNLQGSSTFKWFRSPSITGPDEEISGAVNKTYIVTVNDLNKFISFEVTPVAQTGSLTGTPVRSDRYPIENEKPKAVSVYISGNLYLNQDISGNYAYSDLENDPQGTSTYQWCRADNANGPDIDIPGATQTTYKITTADLNKYLSFKVWPKAASGTINGDPVQSIRLAVKNEKPKANSVDFSGAMYLSNQLTGSYTYSDLENDGQGTSTFKWYRADNSSGPDIEIVGATLNTYILTSQDLNKFLSFEVTPVAISGELTGSPVRSSRKSVLNEAPKATSLTILGNRVMSQTLSASLVFSDLENDNEGTHDYQWFIADAAGGPDVEISGAVNKTFEITRPFLGKFISFRVTPKALTGTITGEPKSSDRFYINAAPRAINVTINGNFRIKQELQGIYTYSDAENDPQGTSEFHWYRSDNADGSGKVLIVGENTSNYTIRLDDMNKYISFEVTPKANSGSLSGIPTTSPFMGPVANSVPTASNVRISGTQLVCKTLKGEYNYDDIEADPEGDSQFKWYRATGVNAAKTVIPGATGREYKLTTEDQGMYIFFEVIPRAISGTTSGSAALSSPTGSIVNTLPTVTILGTSSICNGSAARLTISFTGSSPWKLWYTDGTQKYQLVSSDPVYLLNVTKGGTYKADTLVDNIGCPVTDLPSSATISILPLPQVDIIGVNNAYNLRGNPVQLTGSPSGGTFSGPGVIPSTSMFYPSIAGTQNSPHSIIYEYRSPQTGCSNRDTVIVEVIDADASISGLKSNPKYCNFDTPFIITGTNAVGTAGSFAITGGVGLADNNNNTATINPANLAAGNYTISYSYFDGIQLTIYKDLIIEVLDDARIFGISSDTYCSNASPMEIYSNYIGGAFSGSAVFKNVQTNKYYFNPALDVSGTSKVTYSYTTSYGCVISKTVDKFIAPVPAAEFAVKNNCYNGDSTAFKNKTISTAEISRWEWRFGDSQSSEVNNRSTLFEPKHKYPSLGNRNVRLIAENIYGCKDTVDKVIHLGDIPVADFSWYSECFVKGYPVSFKNKSTNIDDIAKYSWVVEDTSHLDFKYSTKDILHTFPVIKNFTVTFKLSSEFGCSDSLKKVIRLRPIFYLRDTFYSNTFEAGKSYWLPTDSVMLNNWKFGKPGGTRINAAASGSNAYYTSLKDTRKNQQLIVTSPCFSFKGTNRPYIAMETYSDVMKGQEGTVLQYTSDNGLNWTNIGGYNTGINWFNDFAIQSQPAGQQIGWSDKYTGWTNARHNLDQLKTDSLIRFRIVFGQNSKATGNDGFAFDNILIASRSKNVLFEHFTNNSQVESLKANSLLDSIISLNKEDAIAIQYHTSFPGVDSFNMHNPSDPGSRVLYYGIGITPTSYLEGGTESQYIYDFNNKKPNTTDIKNLSMKDVSFKLGFKVEKSSSKISGTLDITALKKVTGRNISARIIVVEDITSQIAGGQVVYKNVVKKILPSAGGTVLSTSWDIGKKEIVNFSWDYKNVYKPSNIHIVAFLQDELTRDIYQVVSDDTSKVKDPVSEVVIKIEERSPEVNVYPNPAKDFLVVEFTETPDNEQIIEIWTINGKKVFSENLFKGVSRFETDVQNLDNGLYFIRILNKNQVIVTKKLVILH